MSSPVKTVIEAPRLGGTYQPFPEDLTIIGIDTPHKSRVGSEGHYLYDERVFLPREENKVLYAMNFGVVGFVLCEKDGEKSLVIEGRQKVLDLREANKRLMEKNLEPRRLRVFFERGQEKDFARIMRAGNALTTEEDPISEARKIHDYFEAYGESPESREEMRLSHNCTDKQIENKRKLLALAPDVQALIQRGRLSPTAAGDLVGLSKDEQSAKVKELLANPEAQSPSGKIRPSAVKAAAGKSVSTKPKKRVISAVLLAKETVPAFALAALSWASGTISDRTACEKIPGLKEVLAEIKEKAAEKVKRAQAREKKREKKAADEAAAEAERAKE